MSRYYRNQLVRASMRSALSKGCDPYNSAETAARELPKLEAMRGANRARRYERYVARMMKRGEQL